tara:strand:- start:4738 stop:5847 length:1110 start_codon:yes stop_codon:yes gene_type:complete
MENTTEHELTQKIRMDVVDRILLGAFILAILGVPASLSRYPITGWLPLYTAHVTLGAIAITSYLTRRQMPIRTKIFIVIGLFSCVGIGGLIQLGLLGVGMWWLVVTSLLFSMLHTPLSGLIFTIFTALGVLAIGWCFINGVLTVPVDPNTYLTSWSSWITLVVATSIMPFFVFQAVQSLQSATHDLFEEVTAQRNRIEELANRDPLTGLLAPRQLTDRLNFMLATSRRYKQRIALLFLDLDGFKSVNDTYGHECGDLMLKEQARRFVSVLREEDAIFRVGGDEFIVLLSQAGSEEQIAKVALRLTQLSTLPFKYLDDSMSVGLSIGISIYPDNGADERTLRLHADQAMYEVKKSGKNGYRFASTDTTEV